MAPAMEAVKVLSSLRAGPGNATRVSPARARRCPADRQVREVQRPAPDPAGEKRPPWAGRALAGGFGPRLVLMPACRGGRGDGPCHWSGAVPLALRAGPGNASRVSPLRGTVPRRPAGPGPTKFQRPPGALGPRLAKGKRAAVARAIAPARRRKARAAGAVSRFADSQPLRPALFRHPVKASSDHRGRRVRNTGERPGS